MGKGSPLPFIIGLRMFKGKKNRKGKNSGALPASPKKGASPGLLKKGKKVT